MIKAAKLVMRICKPCLHCSNSQMIIEFREDVFLEPAHTLSGFSSRWPVFNPTTLTIRVTCDHNYGIQTVVRPLW